MKNGKPDTIFLSPQDFEKFQQVLENPPPPNEKLKAAFKRVDDLKKETIRDMMDKHMVDTSSPKRL